MIYEEHYELKQRPLVVKLAKDCSRIFKNVYHFHPGIELIYIHEGEGKLIIDQHVYPVVSGTLLFIRPYQPHFLQMNITKQKPYVRTLIKYEPNYFQDLLTPFPALSQFHHNLCHAPTIVQVQKLPNLEPFIQNYAHLCEQHASEELMMERNTVFLMALYQWIQPQWEKVEHTARMKTGSDPVIVQIMKWIDENFQSEFQLEALAAEIHLSPNHVSYLFQKSTGYTITSFLTIRRMQHAAVLLKTTSLSIQQIGQRCGYSNYSYFCQAFKKNMGMTPSQYRKISL